MRREAFGELIQIDGSDHRWFENRADACTLLVFIDDATSRLVQLRFVLSESTDSYLSAVHAYVVAFGCPVAFYSDKHTVFRINRSNSPGGTGMTQFGRALAELNIEIICANSSQAKGRVERVNRTLQDRLVKELRLANVSDIDAGNAFLPSFMIAHNERFAVTPVLSDDMHRPLSVPQDKLTDILCHREQRYVGSQLTLSYDRKRIILERNATSEELGGKYVDVYDFPDGRLEVRSKGLLLPYSVFSKDQRVSHTAIVENKRLGHTLALIKAQQDSHFEAKVKTNSEKDSIKNAAGRFTGLTMFPKSPPKQQQLSQPPRTRDVRSHPLVNESRLHFVTCPRCRLFITQVISAEGPPQQRVSAYLERNFITT